MDTNVKSRYYPGTPGNVPDTTWNVYTTRKNRFVKVGHFKVKGSTVEAEMDAHQSIKGYMPYDVAKKIAAERFKCNPLIVEEDTQEAVDRWVRDQRADYRVLGFDGGELRQ